ncbi:MAG: hypothetical protein DHS20C18_23350 [Saprospiraceae bacterium]|nr:MAG: hypothetical protein DHS20C18_23350 [Saprospiraceae bacterium]
MITTVKYPVAVAAIFLWLGFVLAISFMEAWLKFRAPGVTVPIGLGIGRLVFSALNKVEWILAILIFINILYLKTAVFTIENVFFFIPLLLLLVQTTWLLPALDVRANLHINGQDVPPGNLHLYFIGAEIIKVICLFTFGISLFKFK